MNFRRNDLSAIEEMSRGKEVKGQVRDSAKYIPRPFL